MSGRLPPREEMEHAIQILRWRRQGTWCPEVADFLEALLRGDLSVVPEPRFNKT